jgi:hypothetical protein
MATYRLLVHSKASKEPLREDYPTQDEAKDALRQFVSDADSNKNGIVTSKGGGIAIRASDFKGADIRDMTGTIF